LGAAHFASAESWVSGMANQPNPVSSMSAPASTAPAGSAAINEPSESQAARDAGAAMLARAARHPYGRRLFASAVAPDTRADTEEMRESQADREIAAQAARESAARKTAYAVLPTYGRQEGALTQFQEDAIIPKTPLDFALLATGGPFARWAKVGALSLGALLDSTSDAEAGPLGKLLKAGAKSRANLPTDLASRMERARKLGYAEEPFYRGESNGSAPTEYRKGAFFARNKETADGFARLGGQTESREFRLRLDKAFRDQEPATASQYGRLVAAASEIDPPLARQLAETIAPGKGVDWLLGFAKVRPDHMVADKGQFVRSAIEKTSRAPEHVFRRAGFDTLDSGGDVRKLSGGGIRLKDATFDPRRARARNVLAGVPGLLAFPAAASLVDPSPE
jgi:hypothetical protein